MSEEHKIRVMIVDDIVDTREQLEKLLSFETDIEVVATAGDGRQAIQYAARFQPDVIIMDINMPVMDGIAATEAIMKTAPQMRIIIISVQGETDYLRRAMLAGAREFLTKPISPDDFHKSIRYVYHYSSIARHKVSLLNASRQASGFYKSLSNLCKRPTCVLLYMEVSSTQYDIKKLINDNALDIGLSRPTVLLGYKGVAVIIDTANPETIISGIIDTFYAHPIITADNNAILLFGIASGPYNAASDMIEAVVEDFIERRESQGVLEYHEPYILTLEPERELLRHRYYQLLGHYRTIQGRYQNAGTDENSVIRSRIEQLTAIVNHDISSSFSTLQGVISRVISTPSLPEASYKDFSWANRQLLLCTIWQHSLINLGEGRVLQMKRTNVYSWFAEHLKLLQEHLNLHFKLEVIPHNEFLQSEVDNSLLLVACLHLLIVAQISETSKLRVRFHSDDNYNSNTLFIEFIGNSEQFVNKLRADTLVSYQSLHLISSVIQRQRANIKWSVVQGNYCVEISFPRVKGRSSHVLFRKDIQYEIKQLESEIAHLNSNRSLNVKQLVNDFQVAKVLIPHITRLEAEIQKLINGLTTFGSTLESDAITSSIHRTLSLAQYSYLLVRNLELALRGVSLPPKQIDINDQIREVLDMLEHKLSHLNCNIKLCASPPPVIIASVEAKQILLNIIKNAAEATPAGGKLEIETLVYNGFLCVSIFDNGSGIPEEHRERVFQLHFSTKGKGGNSGVGLYAAQTILHRYGGQVQVLSARRNADGALVQWTSGSGLGEMPTLNNPGTLFRVGFPFLEQAQ